MTIFIFVIGFVSLLAAYLPESPWSSASWRAAYGVRGWLIELGRVFIGLGCSLLLVVGVYWLEFCLLVGLVPAGERRIQRLWLRGTMIGLSAFAGIFLVLHHTVWGPQALALTADKSLTASEIWSPPARAEYVTPYLVYFPYSVITMILIFFGVTWLGFYSAWVDFRSASEERADFNRILGREGGGEDGTFDDESGGRVLEALHRFSWAITEIVRRFSYLASAVILVIAYEIRIGATTLSQPAIFWSICAYAVFFVSVAFVILGIVMYDLAYQRAGRRMPLSLSSQMNKLGSFVLLKRMRSQFLFGFLAISTLTLVVVTQTEFFKSWLQGGTAHERSDPQESESAPEAHDDVVESGPRRDSVLAFDGTRDGHGIPSPWELKPYRGRPDIAFVRTPSDEIVAHLRCDNASFAIDAPLRLDVTDDLTVSWRWRATAMPPEGHVGQPGRDDQVLQVLVGFEGGRSISYIWDSNAPVGYTKDSSIPFIARIKVLVVESGQENIDTWMDVKRRVADDFRMLYNAEPPPMIGVRIQTNSQHTTSYAEGQIGPIRFSHAP